MFGAKDPRGVEIKTSDTFALKGVSFLRDGSDFEKSLLTVAVCYGTKTGESGFAGHAVDEFEEWQPETVKLIDNAPLDLILNALNDGVKAGKLNAEDVRQSIEELALACLVQRDLIGHFLDMLKQCGVLDFTEIKSRVVPKSKPLADAIAEEMATQAPTVEVAEEPEELAATGN